ncbi:MAG: hypothetical protein IJC75_03080 [Oscillospiraceae bacterium]|nr:hypothetical protein [Ruminococcus sp.]MBQ4346098.1 hypothetical protein [Oscillospiraceae bacterium]
MSDLFFCPERWEPDPMISTNVAQRLSVKGFHGEPTDAWQLADWWYNWTTIQSKIPIEAGWLESGQEYRFCFWLNGGENDRYDEVCYLEIFGDNWEERLTFKLNRDFTAPLLEKNGWLLYAIPFVAPEATEALTLRFVACGAVCTIAGIPDMNIAACEALEPDARSFERPQRHNIVFPGGWEQPDPDALVLKTGKKTVHITKSTLKKAAIAAGAVAGTVLLGCLLRRKK